VRAVYPACLSGVIVEDEAIEIAAESETQPLPQPVVPRKRLNGSNGSKPGEVIETPALAQESPQKATQPQPEPAAASGEERPSQPSVVPAVVPPPGFTHPLDEALCHLDQQKLSEVLVSRSLIKEGQTYQSCGPDQTKCILSNLPRFLSLAGLDGDSIAC
jgi:hypothetical protein